MCLGLSRAGADVIFSLGRAVSSPRTDVRKSCRTCHPSDANSCTTYVPSSLSALVMTTSFGLPLTFDAQLASVYRMDTVMVDQEPHRSVQLIRRIDTRVPVPLLSQHVASTGATMGRLVDLRAGVSKGTSASAGVGAGSGGSVWGVGSANLGAGASVGTGTGVGRWNAVAKSALGVSRSGSATPVRVPSPAGEVTRSHEVSPGSSRLSLSGAGAGAGAGASGGTKGGVWVSPSVRVHQERENAMVTQAHGGAGPAPDTVETGDAQEAVGDVPDDWEDDV